LGAEVREGRTDELDRRDELERKLLLDRDVV